MTAVVTRIQDWTAPRQHRGAQLTLVDASFHDDPLPRGLRGWYWFAKDDLGAIGAGGPHPTKRDALEEAHDRCPGWETISCL